MIKETKFYQSKLAAAVASKAETWGLCRDFEGMGQFVGYMHIVNDDESKELFEITLEDAGGHMSNFITKSENVVKQINDIMDMIGDEPRTNWRMGFKSSTTKDGKNFIEVILDMDNSGSQGAEGC